MTKATDRTVLSNPMLRLFLRALLLLTAFAPVVDAADAPEQKNFDSEWKVGSSWEAKVTVYSRNRTSRHPSADAPLARYTYSLSIKIAGEKKSKAGSFWLLDYIPGTWKTKDGKARPEFTPLPCRLFVEKRSGIIRKVDEPRTIKKEQDHNKIFEVRTETYTGGPEEEFTVLEDAPGGLPLNLIPPGLRDVSGVLTAKDDKVIFLDRLKFGSFLTKGDGLPVRLQEIWVSQLVDTPKGGKVEFRIQHDWSNEIGFWSRYVEYRNGHLHLVATIDKTKMEK